MVKKLVLAALICVLLLISPAGGADDQGTYKRHSYKAKPQPQVEIKDSPVQQILPDVRENNQVISAPVVVAAANPAPQPEKKYAGDEEPAVGPKIVGDKQFTAHVESSLLLLQEKAPDAHAMVIKYIGSIEQGEQSGMWVEKQPPIFELNKNTALYSITWCAATIAHDSFHSKLYHEYKEKYPGPVPADVYSGQDAELKSIQHQIQVLKQIGAPQDEIKYLNYQDGLHQDVNKDGKYDWEDYYMRNW